MTTQETMNEFYGSVQYDKEPADFMEQTQDGAEAAEEEENSDRETKSMNETYGLRPEELEMPERADDPHGMAFSDSEIESLTMADNEAAKALAFATATPEKRALISATE